MLRSETLFGKRDNSPASPPTGSASSPSITSSASSNPLSAMPPMSAVTSVSSLSPHSSSASLAKLPSASFPEAAEYGLDVMANFSGSGSSSSGSGEGGSKLIVGPNIKLKGVEITDCDTLVVEGKVEATIDSRVIQITECGSFKGAAEIDIAEIHGEFDGELTARQKLVIYAGGKVSGKVRYGKVVIEEGGQLSGDIQVGAGSGVVKRSLVAA